MRETTTDNKIPVIDLTSGAENEPEDLSDELSKHSSMREVLAWAQQKPAGAVHPHLVAEVITQDEFTHDIIVPYRDHFLVYDTT